MHSALEHNYALVNNALYKCCINKLVQSLLTMTITSLINYKHPCQTLDKKANSRLRSSQKLSPNFKFTLFIKAY